MDAKAFDEKKEKLQKKLGDDLASEYAGSATERLKEHVVTLSKDMEYILDQMKNDSKLNTLKEQVKDLSGGYRDAKKEKNTRLQFILMVLQERGAL